MKTKLLLIAAVSVFAASCANSPIDVRIDKSDITRETEEFIVAPASAVKPIVNEVAANALLQKGATKATEILIEATK